MIKLVYLAAGMAVGGLVGAAAWYATSLGRDMRDLARETEQEGDEL
jgi:hypothetical protein